MKHTIFLSSSNTTHIIWIHLALSSWRKIKLNVLEFPSWLVYIRNFEMKLGVSLHDESICQCHLQLFSSGEGKFHSYCIILENSLLWNFQRVKFGRFVKLQEEFVRLNNHLYFYIHGFLFQECHWKFF